MRRLGIIVLVLVGCARPPGAPASAGTPSSRPPAEPAPPPAEPAPPPAEPPAAAPSADARSNAAIAASVRAHRPPVALVRAGERTIDGALTAEALEPLLRRYTSQVRRCADLSLKKGRAAIGRLDLSLAIRRDGAVQAAIVRDGPLADAPIAACMTAAARRLRFPGSTDGGPVLLDASYLVWHDRTPQPADPRIAPAEGSR